MDSDLHERWQRWQNSGDALIDLRSCEQFRQLHVRGATSLPLTELRDRRHELPDRGARLYLLHDADMSDAQALLQDWGYELLDTLQFDESFLTQISDTISLESGTHTRQLWRPCPLLSRHIMTLENQCLTRCALDVACGSGRDSLYLAQRGWQVTAVDVQQDAISRLRLSAERHHVSIDTICQNIERDLPAFGRECFDLIVVVRYLHRPLLPLFSQWLKRGGFLLYQQFHTDAAAYGRPRSSAHLLRDGELVQAFNGWQVLVDEMERLDDGRPMVNFLARKP